MPYVDFKAVKTAVSIERAAKLLSLETHKEAAALRAPCPACQNDDPRILTITPAKGLFFCRAADVGGDTISLAAHILSLSMRDAAEWLQDTLPQEREEHRAPSPTRRAEQKEKSATNSRSAPEKLPKEFDAAAFASKLAYTEEVSALGITEEHAEQFGIGFCSAGSMRGFTCFPVTDGLETHYIGWNGSELKLPKWKSNIVKLKRA
jgi:DNA primase